jgi:nicotinate-nucleotide pyrophosphorylase (carboxylating)
LELSGQADVVSWAERPNTNHVKVVKSWIGKDHPQPANLSNHLHQRPTLMEQVQSITKRSTFHGLGRCPSPNAVGSVKDHHVVPSGHGIQGSGQACNARPHHRDTNHDTPMGCASKGRWKGCFEEVAHTPIIMADAPLLPHDRGHELWTMEEGASRKLTASIDRWVGAMVADDGIDMPLSGGGPAVEATVFARQDGLVVGCAVVDYMLQIWAPSVRVSWFAGDGKRVSSGDEIAMFSGKSEDVLAVERLALNALGQLSGVATETKRWSAIAPKQIACTRKTIWGLLDKWAVHMGGGLTHRLSKDDAVMIKENDLASMHDHLETHAERLITYLQDVDTNEVGAFLEVETRTDKEALMAAMVWSQRRSEQDVPRLVIMLDNFSPEQCKTVNEQMEDQGIREHVVLEASGGIVFDELKSWHECGLDVVSTSVINRGVSPLDMSMLVKGL